MYAYKMNGCDLYSQFIEHARIHTVVLDKTHADCTSRRGFMQHMARRAQYEFKSGWHPRCRKQEMKRTTQLRREHSQIYNAVKTVSGFGDVPDMLAWLTDRAYENRKTKLVQALEHEKRRTRRLQAELYLAIDQADYPTETF